MDKRMDVIVETATRQGYRVIRFQTTGSWHFIGPLGALAVRRTPATPREWAWLMGALRGFGVAIQAGFETSLEE